TIAGGAVGAALRRRADRTPLRPLDRVLGGALSLVVAALSVSLVAQSVALAGIPGLSAAVSSSQVVRAIDALTPTPISSALAQLRQEVLADGLPTLGELIDLGPSTSTSAAIDLDDPDLDAAADAVARVSGTAYACGETLTGTGFVIADDRVITNAHVVAGISSPVVELPGKGAAEGEVVYFDPIDDLAVIAVDTQDAPVLELADTLQAGDSAVIDGYPYGGPFTTSTAVVRSVGTANVPDIYDDSSSPREIYALAATVAPGNSGGPLLTADGDVAGLVFARADDGSQIGYAMTVAELEPVVAQAPAATAAVSTGDCAG
ncbi:MAG: MarP family serine protease, partial [Microbacterium sp.]|uniref:MarP family serine protease n=1 Tax=Microbacterium sp. TaxID=51671 RepID=UPI0039E45E4A